MKVKRWIVGLLIVAVVTQLLWLILVNGALYLPATQHLISQVRPDKLTVRWERAWSPYPGRFHASGVFANGETRTQQWQVEVRSASGSLALLPLLAKRVNLSDIEAFDADYRQRPRLRADRDYSDRLPYFPDIEGRELNDAITTPRKAKRPWKGRLDGGVLRGRHSAWIMNMKASGEGTVHADLTFESHGGPFSIDAEDVDVRLDALVVNEDYEAFQSGEVTGSFGLDPVIVREHKDLSLLGFLTTDAKLSFNANSLKFLNLFLVNFENMTVDGGGRVSGRLHFDRGNVLAGTELSIDAERLQLAAFDLDIAGSGSIDVQRNDDTRDNLALTFDYRDLTVTHAEDSSPLLTGRDLALAVTGGAYVLAVEQGFNFDRAVSFSFNELNAPDLGLLQRYLPVGLPLELLGGNGVLEGALEIASSAAAVDLRLRAGGADLGLGQYRYTADLDAALVIENPDIGSVDSNLAGTFLRLNNARLQRIDGASGEPWDTSFAITEGRLGVVDWPAGEDVDLFSMLADAPMREIFGYPRGSVSFESELSSLGFLSIFLGDRHHTRITGQGSMSGTVNLADGLPAAGTRLDVRSSGLAVEIVDYVAEGDGIVELALTEGGEAQDWSLSVQLREGLMRHREDKRAAIDTVSLALEAELPDVRLDAPPEDYSIDVRIPSARVTDLAIFNRHLPEGVPLELIGGRADLVANLQLTEADAAGEVRLLSSDLEASFDLGETQYRFAADLDVGLAVPRLDIASRNTDITGTYFRLSNARVSNPQGEVGEPWEAAFRIRDGRIGVLDRAKGNGDGLAGMTGRQILEDSSASFSFDSELSSLAWLAAFLGDRNHTRISGSGNMHGTVSFAGGLPAPGTGLEINSSALSVGFMDYIAEGDGNVWLAVEEDGEVPDWHLTAELNNAGMRRSSEDRFGIEDVSLELQAEIEDVTYGRIPEDFTVNVTMPSARIPDMAGFNVYLPDDAPIELTGGHADLAADLWLTETDVGGSVRLVSRDLEARVSQTLVSTDLDANVELAGGDPSAMRFDIRGSNIDIGNTRVIGEERSFDEETWSAHVELDKGIANWTKPLRVELEAQLTMSDSRPFVALLSNEGWVPRLFERAIILEDITGTGRMRMADDVLRFPYVRVASENVEVGLKGSISKGRNEGIVMVGLRRLAALLRIDGDERNIEVFRARKRFDEFQVEQ